MSGNVYDMLGRATQTINAWDGTPNPTPTSSTNQITTRTYDGNDDVLSLTAVMPSGQNSQVTGYVYGVGGTAGLNLFSNNLISTIEYPDKSTGQPATVSSEQQSFRYNLLGEETSFTDQNGSTHSYLRDVLGRLSADVVTNIGPDVDGTIQRLGYTYNALGLPYQDTSYSDTAGAVIANQVEDLYNGFGQLTNEYQAHSGPVYTSSTPQTQYFYDQSGNWSRLVNTVYPNTRGLVDDYGSSGLDYQISRIGLQEDYYGAVQDYFYLGLDTVIGSMSYPWNIGLTYVKATTESIGDAGDMYTGLDRFGRVVQQRWTYRSGLTGTSGGITLGTVLENLTYGYDRDSNILYAKNNVNPNFSALFTYDPLNRLTSFSRGTLNSSNTAIVTPNPLAGSTNDWSLNAIGDITASGGVSRTINSQNQVTGVGSNSLNYDNNGNMLFDQSGGVYTYDAWNRQVSIDGGYVNRFDALGREIYQGTTGHDLFYNSTGNVIEERNSSGTVTDQYVWGLMYPNQLVLRDDNSVSGNLGINGSGLGYRLFAMQDLTFNVTGMVDTSGVVQQRYLYDPYGAKTLLDANYNVLGTDTIHLAPGFQGGWTDPVSGMIRFGARLYDPFTGTWTQAEPFGGMYIDGADLYRAMGDNPIAFVDPTGLFIIEDPVVQQELEGAAVDIWSWGSAGAMGAYTYGADFLKDRWIEQRDFFRHLDPILSDFGQPHTNYGADPRTAAARAAALAKAKAQQQANAPDTNYNSTGGDFGGSSKPPKAPPGGASTQPSGGDPCPTGGGGPAGFNRQQISKSAMDTEGGKVPRAVRKLQQRAGEKPDLWGKPPGSLRDQSAAAERNLNEIMDGGGPWIDETGNTGPMGPHYEKYLPDGRGVAVDPNGNFITFVHR